MSVLGLLSLSMFAFAALVLLILWLFQMRDARALARLSRAVREAQASDPPADHVDFASDHPDLSVLTSAVNGLLREEFGKRTVHEVVSGERDDVMNKVRERVELDARKIGVSIVDVRLKRVDLPQGVSADVYRRMESERKRAASELRSTGSAEAEKIRADAEKQREVILAEAYRDAQKIKGEGDAKAATIYAAAFQQNPEFYSFYRSMEAYKSSFRGKSDLMVVEPNSDFFRYLRDSAGKTSGKK